MAYFVHIDDTEQAFLDGLELSPQAKTRIDRFIHEEIANVSDSFRQSHGTEGGCFVIRLQLFDRWGTGRHHAFDFHIIDSHAEAGVLVIGFINPV